MSYPGVFENPTYPHVETMACRCGENGSGACPKCSEPICEKCEWRCETCLEPHHLKCLTPVEDFYLCKACLGKHERADDLGNNLFEMANSMNRAIAVVIRGDAA